MVVKYIKVTILTMVMMMVGTIFSMPKINAQSTVDIDIYTYYDGDEVAHSQRTVSKGDRLVYEVGDFPDGVFMYWVINGHFRDDLGQNITITVYQDTILEIHFGSDIYYSGFLVGFDFGETYGYEYGYDEGYDEGLILGVSAVYYDGFGGFINPDTNKLYDETASYPYGVGFNDGVEAHNDFSFIGLLTQVFVGMGSILAIELLPNITIGAIIAVPIVFGIIYFILGKKRGD